ncbi:MAG: 4-hydroxythreonine-4-phosphate dehydrogenase PdxA [Phycisphaerae bacterium]|jgi:4-hydroxythreonine-4-phosphate dehydrogenase|nr:4-hydroxythreonine-4-phosphate dehydrogenase PdxA [Phycisphaerae bacterium]
MPQPRNSPPIIGITMGDPAGIGPEVTIKALADVALRRSARFVIYGQNDLLTYAADRAAIHPYWFRVAAASERAGQPFTGDVTVLDYPGEDLTRPGPAAPSRSGGLASKQFVEDAITDALRDASDPRHIDAIVTGPISKESWSLANFRWPGHTELFAARTKAKRHAMMFVSPRLTVALATAHVALMDIRNVLTIGRVFDPIDLGAQLCRRLGKAKPTVAVCGLNPHAGENGLFGDEEERIIRPAIEVARRHGIDARGPYPGDTVFIDAAAGKFDLVLAMYHDQGLIPVKLLGWDRAVNVTVGLPIVRTSPDHGTAFNIAGTNSASEGSMRAAIELAVRMASLEPASPAEPSLDGPPLE